jgi:hypothetical protein
LVSMFGCDMFFVSVWYAIKLGSNARAIAFENAVNCR